MKQVQLGDKMVKNLSYIFISIFALICILPFYLVIINSFSDNNELIRTGYSLFPKRFSLQAYEYVFSSNRVYTAYGITVFITVVGTLLSILITSALSYAISIKSLRQGNKIAFFVYFTMLFNGGLVPWYILISRYLHLSNNIFVMIIPFLINTWYMFLLRNFFKTIPESFAESAKLDGANDIYILFKIVLPLSLPALAAISLFYALDYWNQWYAALFFIDDKNKYPLQYIIMQIIRNANFTNQMVQKVTGVSSSPPTYTIKLATSIVTIGPIVFIYPFIQKYFIKGLMVGAIKG